MIHVTLILITALVFSFFGTPLAKRVAMRVGIISVPRSRDIHVAPVPLLGGAAIYVAFVVTFLAVNSRGYISEALGILLGATLIALVGLVDDRWGIPASFKMLAQVGAAILLVFGGVQVYLFTHPWLNWLLTIVWVVGITNALNLLDNMDGLSGGVAFVAAAFFLLLATMNEPRQVMVAAMAAALMGACAGFLRYNFTSSIFMGDTGSMFIGFILAVLAIKLRFLSNVTVVTWMVPVFVLGLPIFDTSLVFASRIRRGVNPFTTAGKDHISHRFVALGLTRRESVLVCFLIAGCCGMVGVYVTQATLDEAYVVASIMAVLLVVGVVWFEYVCPSGVCRTPKTQG